MNRVKGRSLFEPHKPYFEARSGWNVGLELGLEMAKSKK